MTLCQADTFALWMLSAIFKLHLKQQQSSTFFAVKFVNVLTRCVNVWGGMICHFYCLALEMLVPERPSRCTGCSVHHLLIVVVLWIAVAIYYPSGLTQVASVKTHFEFLTDFMLCMLLEMREIPWNSNAYWWFLCTGHPHAIHSTWTLFITS